MRSDPRMSPCHCPATPGPTSCGWQSSPPGVSILLHWGEQGPCCHINCLINILARELGISHSLKMTSYILCHWLLIILILSSDFWESVDNFENKIKGGVLTSWLILPEVGWFSLFFVYYGNSKYTRVIIGNLRLKLYCFKSNELI